MVYYVPGQTEETEVIELNFHKVQKRGKNSFTADQIEKALPRLHAMTRETTIMDVKRLILEKMRGIFEKVPEDDETLNEIVQVHIQNNLPMIKTGTYIKERAKCEFAGRKLSYKEDYSELKFDDVDVNESVDNA